MIKEVITCDQCGKDCYDKYMELTISVIVNKKDPNYYYGIPERIEKHYCPKCCKDGIKLKL